MSPEQLGALVKFRLEQGRETLGEAEVLLERAGWRGAVNRAYYAMFYAILALLATRQLSTSKHSGVLSLFDREFVKPGLLPRSLSRSARLAFNRRQAYDYGEIAPVDQLASQETVDDARRFIAAIEDFLRAEGFLSAEKE